MRVVAALGVIAACLAWSADAPAQPASAPERKVAAPHITVELLSTTDQPATRQQSIALQFTIEQGWHLYWLNPGDSGSPPEVRWQLPPSVKGAPMEWPLPERLVDDGSVNYGYRGTVVLPVSLTLPASAGTAALAVRADVEWLVCRNLCVAGKAALGLTLPLDPADRALVPQWRQLIARARRQVPRPAPASWKATARSTKDSFVLEVSTGYREVEGTVFPMDVSQIDDGAPQGVAPLPAGLRFTLRKSQQLMKDPATLRVVVSLSGGRTGIVDVAVGR